MNLRQKKKLFKKKTGKNPSKWIHYGTLRYHKAIGKPWGGMAALRKIEAARAVESFNRRIRNRNYLIREARRYTRGNREDYYFLKNPPEKNGRSTTKAL